MVVCNNSVSVLCIEAFSVMFPSGTFGKSDFIVQLFEADEAPLKCVC